MSAPSPSFSLHDLERIIAGRANAGDDASYTSQLLAKGTNKCAEKLGEEAVETVIAAISEPDDALTGELADLFYHALVVMKAREIPLDAVCLELERRTGQSGLAEKASRADGHTGHGA